MSKAPARQDTPKDIFQAISFAPDPSESWKGAIVVLDTHVVSAIDGIAANGFRPGHPAHLRAANLLRKAWRDEVEGIHHALDTLEASGFHRGGVESYNAIHRYVAVRSILLLGPQGLEEFLRSGEPIEGAINLQGSREINRALQDIAQVMPWVYLPAYAASLTAHLARRTSRNVLDVMVDVFQDAPIIPDVPLLALLLSELGNGDLRGHIRDGIFNVQRTGDPIAMQSAAWDLAHLEYLDTMSIATWRNLPKAGAPTAAQLFLITEDKNLAALGHALIEPEPHAPLRPRINVVPTANKQRFERLLAELQMQSSLPFGMDPKSIDRQMGGFYLDTIRRLETRLEVVPLKLDVWPMESQPVERNWPFILRILDYILDTNESLIEFLRLSATEMDVLSPLLHYTVLAFHEVSRARDLSVEQALERVLIFDNQSRDQILDGQMLVAAACQNEDSGIFLNALLKRIALEPDSEFGPVVFTIAMILRRTIEDIADARQVEPHVIVKVLQENIRKANDAL